MVDDVIDWLSDPELVRKVAQAICDELNNQDSIEPERLPDDGKLPWLDQGEVDMLAVARAALTAATPDDLAPLNPEDPEYLARRQALRDKRTDIE